MLLNAPKFCDFTPFMRGIKINFYTGFKAKPHPISRQK